MVIALKKNNAVIVAIQIETFEHKKKHFLIVLMPFWDHFPIVVFSKVSNLMLFIIDIIMFFFFLCTPKTIV